MTGLQAAIVSGSALIVIIALLRAALRLRKGAGACRWSLFCSASCRAAR